MIHLPDFADLLHPLNVSKSLDLLSAVQMPNPAEYPYHPDRSTPSADAGWPRGGRGAALGINHVSHHPSRGEYLIHAPALVYSTRNRAGRLLSPYAMALLARCMERAPLVRLALHPRDAQHPALMRHMQALLTDLLHTHTPMTKFTFATRRAALVK